MTRQCGGVSEKPSSVRGDLARAEPIRSGLKISPASMDIMADLLRFMRPEASATSHPAAEPTAAQTPGDRIVAVARGHICLAEGLLQGRRDYRKALRWIGECRDRKGLNRLYQRTQEPKTSCIYEDILKRDSGNLAVLRQLGIMYFNRNPTIERCTR